MNRRRIYITEDGTSSFFDNEIGEMFHSKYGAINESRHIFIKSGLEFFQGGNEISILEIGWGTGLNTLLTLEWHRKNQSIIHYHCIEKYPLSESEAMELNYYQYIQNIDKDDILHLHKQPWNTVAETFTNFHLYKSHSDIQDLKLDNCSLDLIYFDAFSPDKQPELWSVDVFKRIYNATKDGGILTTYSAKGDVRRVMKQAGFNVERIQGPIGKRHITRAIKK